MQRLTRSWKTFDGGRRESVVELRDLQQQQAAIDYLRAGSVRKMDDALSGYEADRRQVGELKERVRNATDAYELVQARYESGVIDFINVLDAQRSRIQASRDLAAAQARANPLGAGKQGDRERAEEAARRVEDDLCRPAVCCFGGSRIGRLSTLGTCKFLLLCAPVSCTVPRYEMRSSHRVARARSPAPARPRRAGQHVRAVPRPEELASGEAWCSGRAFRRVDRAPASVPNGTSLEGFFQLARETP